MEEAAAGAATGSLISAGGSLVSSIVNALYDNYQSNRQRQWNEKMVDKQNAWSLDMWNRTNEYNSPSEQIQRMRDAGLNPLYYGLDGTSANAFESAQPLGYERSTAPLMSNPVDAIYSARLKDAQIDNINADTAMKNNENITETERRQNLIKERDEMDARIKNYLSQANVNEKTAAKIDQYMKYADDIYQAQIDKDNNAAKLTETQRKRIEELLPGEKEIQNMTIKDFRVKWRKMMAEIEHMAAQDKLLGKEAKYYLYGLLSSGFQGSGLSLNNAAIYTLINEDPDLTEDERKNVAKAFGIEEPKSENQPLSSISNSDSNYDIKSRTIDPDKWKKKKWDGRSPHVDEAMRMLGYDND